MKIGSETGQLKGEYIHEDWTYKIHEASDDAQGHLRLDSNHTRFGLLLRMACHPTHNQHIVFCCYG